MVARLNHPPEDKDDNFKKNAAGRSAKRSAADRSAADHSTVKHEHYSVQQIVPQAEHSTSEHSTAERSAPSTAAEQSAGESSTGVQGVVPFCSTPLVHDGGENMASAGNVRSPHELTNTSCTRILVHM